MGLFQGNLNNTDTGLHLFTTDDKSLALLGLSSFTVASISGYFQENIDTLKEFFSIVPVEAGNSTANIPKEYADFAMKNLLGIGSLFKEEDFQILAFNSDTKKYNMKTGEADIFNGIDCGSGLLGLCQQHDWAEYGYLNNTPATKELVVNTINNIQNSSSGCLSYKPMFYVRGELRSAEIKVFFQDKANRSNDRVVAEKYDPKTKLLVGVPRTSSGRQYGWSETNSSTNIGVYNSPLEGGVNNPKNTVAAPLKMTFNKSLGMWESGTQQILARLLTDIDPAAIPRIIPDLDTIDNLPPEETIDPDSPNNMSPFSHGIAMPLCLEKGNPYMFGPNIKGDCNNEKEKIKVVNRSPRSFKKHDIVMCSLIDSEWIIQGFDNPVIAPVETKVNKWFFQKYIADSSVYFKDTRLATNGSPNTFITPDIYEEKMRKKYYMSLLDLGVDDQDYFSPKIETSTIRSLKKLGGDGDDIINNVVKLALINLNLDTTDQDASNLKIATLPKLDEYDFYPSSGYYQSSIFDNLGRHMGGCTSANVISRTNIEVCPNGQSATQDAGDYEKLAGFWGPLFPDGYNASQIADFKKNRADGRKMLPNNAITNTYWKTLYSRFITGNGSGVTSVEPSVNMQRDASNYLFADENDGNFKQLPAEVALNGSIYSSNGSPIENINLLKTCEKGNLLDQFYRYRNNINVDAANRYEWLAVSGSISGVTPFYGFTPIKPNRIQFSPLQTEFATNDAYLPTGIQAAMGVTADSIIPFFPPASGFRKNMLQDQFFHSDLWGFKFWYGGRNQGRSPQHIKYSDQVPYPTYSNDPTGGPGVFPYVGGKEKSNVVGIIAAKNKFVTQPGATVTFTTKQYSGLSPDYSAAVGGGGAISVILGVILQDAFTGAKNYSKKNWGSIGDNYSDFGTTALYVRVFDQWPDEQTIYDGRYFSVLHFNPDQLGWDVETTRVDGDITFNDSQWTPAKGQPAKYPRNVDKATSSVDFRIPTTCDPETPSLDNKIIPVGTIINKEGANGSAVRKPSEWRVNPIRRGQLLTGGGFRYYKRIIALVNPDAPMSYLTIKDAGKNYAVDDIIKFINKAQCRVTAVTSTGGVAAISFIDKDGNYTIGEGFMPEDFKNALTQTSVTTTNGSGLKIEVTAAVVYDIIQKDAGPQDRLKNIQKLTIGSSMGEKEAAGELVTSIQLENNGTGKYEAFYHFHNDILYTITQSQTKLTIGRFPQYVTMEMKAG